ncbi:unnamed protein product [Danaus chrysippus]|uniref:(African queen) hypothetical protein n=1 Tax=Danaus chrysippus TaxID=151541 RepID=A0A8J2QGB8_9NEOP|nr:unnamed protein product [Danaus chrysippus]
MIPLKDYTAKDSDVTLISDYGDNMSFYRFRKSCITTEPARARYNTYIVLETVINSNVLICGHVDCRVNEP